MLLFPQQIIVLSLRIPQLHLHTDLAPYGCNRNRGCLACGECHQTGQSLSRRNCSTSARRVSGSSLRSVSVSVSSIGSLPSQTSSRSVT